MKKPVEAPQFLIDKIKSRLKGYIKKYGSRLMKLKRINKKGDGVETIVIKVPKLKEPT